MSYIPYYTAHFTNEQSQEVDVTIYKKDGDPDTVTEAMEVTSFELTDNGEDQTKYNWIFIRELSLSVFLNEGNTVTWETFITAIHDEWKIIVTIDTQPYFHGFITPDEGNAPFQDKPYDLTITATNGLALLKDVPLVDVDGVDFVDDNTLISYIAGALKQTLLDLPIRIYCGVFATNMFGKADSINWDMFQQAYLDYRTFKKDAVTFTSCYEALKIILYKFCSLEYWNGMWLIQNIAEKQYRRGDNFYVDYDVNGENPAGAQDDNNYSQVGANLDLYPINENQQISSRFAVKSVKTIYNYNIWPEIPLNNKFERGEEFETGDAPDEDDIDNDGDVSEIIGTYKKFTIPDWDFGIVDLFTGPTFPMSAPEGDSYRKSIYNFFGVELERKIVIDTPTTSTSGIVQWLRCKPIPVNRGDKFKISTQKKFANDFTGSGDTFTQALRVYLVLPSGTDYYALSNTVGGAATNVGRWVLESGTPPDALIIDYVEDQNSTKYADCAVETLACPADGDLYIAFNCSATGSPGAQQFYKDFQFEYLPFVGGGYIPVKGDYWLRSQNVNFPDKAEEEVFISDSLKRVLKGALIFKNETVDELLGPSWYRTHSVATPNPGPESKAFKELLNLGRFNHSYRRMYYLEGEFNGLNDAPENNQTNKTPIGFFKRYREQDLTEVRDFIMVAPLKMDIVRGWVNANLVEVRKDADGDDDGTQDGDTSNYNFIF